MNVHISYKFHKTPDIEKDVSHLLEKLQTRLHAFRPELVHLRGVMEQNSPREGFVVSLNLRLPSGQMAVQKSAPSASMAVKEAFGDLLHQLNKHKALLRNPRKWIRRQGPDGIRVVAEVPFEQTFAAVQFPAASSDDIRSYLNVSLRRLERFVERELYFREDAEQICADDITCDEVIDEVVARALGDGESKPERLALEPWLYRLAVRTIDDLAGDVQDRPSVHLEESTRRPNVRASDEPELQFHQPDETFTRESVIADQRVATPEDLAYSDEMLKLVRLALGNASHTEREAFLLHAIEGFSVDEIAAITDSAADQVRASIVAARAHIHRSSPLAKGFREPGLRNTGTG